MSPAQANASLPAGFQLEGYRIARQISLGGFSIVYLAHDASGHPLAIKEYLPNTLSLRSGTDYVPQVADADRAAFNHGLQCFFEEGRTLALLDHPNVVRVTDFFRANGTAYLVMRYERGRTLAEHIGKHGGALDEGTIRALFTRLLNGLREVHSHRLLHLDIKPANLFLRSDGVPVLLDFGAARQVLGHEAPRLRSVHTQGFAAPEQYGEPDRLGPWTDIYAVGATLHTCLSAQAPAAADRRLAGESMPRAADRFAGRYSRHLLATVDHCLELDPLARPQSVYALQKELARRDYAAVGRSWLDRLRGKGRR
ncbi:MAG: serine/threonine protein kinase [Proteobacteria bacterium]|nr:serine/threonine protein kinase [Pseudomonadota bacterium]HQR04795.1 serine/threonine-protein kinase [Rhodocyclaceae bacterium]